MVCRVNIRNITLSSSNFVVIEISNFEKQGQTQQQVERETSSESLTISVISQLDGDQNIDSFGDVDVGSVISVIHTTVT